MSFLKQTLIKILPPKIIRFLLLVKDDTLYLTYKPFRIIESSKLNNRLTNRVKIKSNQFIINIWFFIFQRPVSIIIPSYNDFDFLKSCLESVLKTVKSKVEIIVVDDYCQESSRKKLKTLESKKVKVIYRKENGGFSKAVNTGIKEAKLSNDIIILNSDIVCQKYWFQNLMYGAYVVGDNVGICGPKLLYPDNTIQSGGSYRADNKVGFEHYFRFEPQDNPLSNINQYCLAITGACLYIKREVINKIDVFNPEFKFTYEDIDFCFRALSEGFRILYYPKAQLIHYEGQTRNKNKKTSQNIKYSMDKFWQIWAFWFDKPEIRDDNNQLKIIFIASNINELVKIKNIINKPKNHKLNIMVWSLYGNLLKYNPVLTIDRLFINNNELFNQLSQEKAIKVSLNWQNNYLVNGASFRNGKAVFLNDFDNFDELIQKENNQNIKNLILGSNRQELININSSNFNETTLKTLEIF